MTITDWILLGLICVSGFVGYKWGFEIGYDDACDDLSWAAHIKQRLKEY